MAIMDDTRNFGIIIFIVGALSIIVAMMNLFLYNGKISEVAKAIVGVLFVLFGVIVMTRYVPNILSPLFPDGVTSKYGTFVAFVSLSGVTVIVDVIIGHHGLIISTILFLLGVSFIAVGFLSSIKRKTIIDSVAWYIITALFLMLSIGTLFFFIDPLTPIEGVFVEEVLSESSHILKFITCLTAFFYILDPDVKSKF